MTAGIVSLMEGVDASHSHFGDCCDGSTCNAGHCQVEDGE